MVVVVVVVVVVMMGMSSSDNAVYIPATLLCGRYASPLSHSEHHTLAIVVVRARDGR